MTLRSRRRPEHALEIRTRVTLRASGTNGKPEHLPGMLANLFRDVCSAARGLRLNWNRLEQLAVAHAANDARVALGEVKCSLLTPLEWPDATFWEARCLSRRRAKNCLKSANSCPPRERVRNTAREFAQAIAGALK